MHIYLFIYSRKNTNWVGISGVWNGMEFPGVWQKKQIEIPGVPQKRSEVFSGDQEKNVKFPWVLVFGYEIFRGCNMIFQNFQG